MPGEEWLVGRPGLTSHDVVFLCLRHPPVGRDGDVAVRMTPPPTDSTAPKKEKPAATALGPSFSSGEPVDVTSDRLVVDDGKHTAMFRANVIARQGTSTLAAPELDVFYAGRSALPGAAASR